MYFSYLIHLMLFAFSFQTCAHALTFSANEPQEYSTQLPDQAACQTVMVGIAMRPITPQFPFTIELGYAPLRRSCGMFGYAWRSPQLESHILIEDDHIFWITPWLQQLAFTRKQGESVSASPWESEDGLWQVTFPPMANGEVIIQGKGIHEGWSFVYDVFRLTVTKIESPDKGVLRFIYDKDDRLKRIDEGSGNNLFQFVYENHLVVEIKHLEKNSVRLTYEKGPIGTLISGLPTLPPSIDDQIRLVRFQVNDLPKRQFDYDQPCARPDKIEESNVPCREQADDRKDPHPNEGAPIFPVDMPQQNP